MLYSNVKVASEERTFDFGTIHQIALGEIGRGRKLMAITCPAETVVEKGMNEHLSVGKTKSGKARINSIKDDELYLLLSSQGGYTRRGDGSIWVPSDEHEKYETLAVGWGADGLAGRIGTWDVVLLKAPKEGIVRVRTSGGGYGTPSDYYVIKDGKVYHTYLSELEECCATLKTDVADELFAKIAGELVWPDNVPWGQWKLMPKRTWWKVR